MAQFVEKRDHVAEEAEEVSSQHSNEYSASRPWDTRGETGLYGGGGRGADNQETGWVSNYAVGTPGHAQSREEDLRYEDEEVQRTTRNGSKDTSRTAGRKSSSGTTQSSHGPITPTNTSFTVRDVPHIAYVDPVPSVEQPTTFEPKVLTSRLPISTPMSTMGKPQLNKKTSSKGKTAPKISAPIITAKNPDPSVAPSTTPTRRKSVFDKFRGSKKMPKISAPILPDGFVEALGMETIALTPGDKLPIRHLINGSPVIEQNAPVMAVNPATPTQEFQKESKQDQSARAKSIRKEIASNPPASAVKPADLNVLITHPDGTSSQPSQAYQFPVQPDGPRVSERFSRDSESSFAPSTANTLASAENTRSLFFSGLREEQARKSEENLRGQAVGPSISAMPLSYPSPSKASSEASRSVTSSDGFRNPWAAGASATAENRDSFNSLDATPVPRPTSFNARNRRQSMAPKSASHYYRAPSGGPGGYSATTSRFSGTSSNVSSANHRGSTSSAYSEYSNLDHYYSPAPHDERNLHSTQPLNLTLNRGGPNRKSIVSKLSTGRPDSAAGSIIWGSQENRKPSPSPVPVPPAASFGDSMGFRNPFG